VLVFSLFPFLHVSRMVARYHHLSPAFLADAVGRLDAVFGELRYQDVTAQKQLEATSTVSC
jgi:hypothetical protein